MKELVHRYDPVMIILRETKLLNIDREVVGSVCHFSNPGWIAVHSMGAAVGIMLI